MTDCKCRRDYTDIAALACITILCILFSGEPDLVDAAIHYIMGQK